jgi:hypothetical protein
MKTELGFKDFKKLVRDKIKPISMDLVNIIFSTKSDCVYRLKTT